MAKVKLLDPSDPRRKLEKYELIGEIATGGMATVFLARRGGAGGFQRFVAIKRLHPHLQSEPEFVEMFLDEARLAALIHHPNVVPILEVGESDSGYYLVMEYVEGDTLSRIVARTMSNGELPPRHVILRIMLDALAGLHAAHELRDDRGQLLGLVHRDVSPQNVLVGVDGTARITDFGVARATARLTSTGHGKLKGKLAYMAPEQTRGDELDRRTDLFAMGIILWEVLVGKRLFKQDSEAATLQRILVEPIRPPSSVIAAIPKVFDEVVLRALDRDQERRFQNAADMADALEAAAREAAKINVTDVGVASPREVASFVQRVLGQEIGAQRESVRAWLAQSDSGQPIVFPAPSNPPPTPPPATVPDASRGLQRGTDPMRPPSGGAPSPATGRVEMSADVTMRFALEEAKRQELPPKPAVPPSAPPPSRPRPPPPAKPSQPTLLGQGPTGRAPGPHEPPRPAAGAPAPKPTALLADSGGPEPANRLVSSGPSTMAGVGPEAAALAAVAAEAASAVGYSATMSDDLGEDAVTVARGHSSYPPSVNHAALDAAAAAIQGPIEPAVKTARGLFAEPLLAGARAHAAAHGNGGSINGAGSVSPSGMPRTPKMPMPADAIEPVAPLGASHGAPGSGRPGQQSVGAARVQPRTLMSSGSSGEVLTPESMTLPERRPFGATSSSPGGEFLSTQDPTVIHAAPKRGIGRYVVVFAAFLLVFAIGLLVIKKTSTDTPTASTAKPTATEKAAAPNFPLPPTSLPTASSTAAVQASASAKIDEPTARPRPGAGRPRPPATSSPKAPKNPPTSETAKPKGTGEEDFGNPYR